VEETGLPGENHSREVESVNVFPGERFDIIVHTDQSIGNYWMRIRGEADCSVKKAKQVAIVRYEGDR
jgi:hypothetical protein